MFYLLIGGAPLGLAYKAINTMDSMVGYKNERYLHFGRAAARLDDAANYIPARLAALLWIAARLWGALTRKTPGGSGGGTAAAMPAPTRPRPSRPAPGRWGVQLAGPAWYFGEYYDKPAIGDPDRPVTPGDILRADRMLYLAGLLALGLGLAARMGGLLLWELL